MDSLSRLKEELADCPLCYSLCLSPTVLPCGHLICRKCFRHMVDERGRPRPCPFCGHAVFHGREGQTVRELANQLGKDLVIEDLVHEQLASIRRALCLACPNKPAMKVCLDCKEMYCDLCSNSHEKMQATKDHIQRDFPKASLTPGTTPNEDVASSSASAENGRCEHDIRPVRERNAESLRQEARLFQQEVLQLQSAETIVDANMVQLQEVKDSLVRQQQMLTTYITRLSKPDDQLLPNAQAFLPRLQRVREKCQPPPEGTLATAGQGISSLKEAVTAIWTGAEVLSKAPAGDGTYKATFSGGVVPAHNPMTSVPTRAFLFKPDVAGDKAGPWITSVACTKEGQLVMADYKNDMIKTAVVRHQPITIKGLQLESKPFVLALLRDGMAAVTAEGKRIFYVDVSGPLSVVSHVHTTKEYWGLDAVLECDMLVAGCQNPGTVDVLSRAGEVVKTVVDSSSLPGLTSPAYLCVKGKTVWVSNWTTDTVFKVELDTGRVIGTLTSPKLQSPHQVCVDTDGNCYIACRSSQSVLLVTPNGQWRRLLVGQEHGDVPRVCARGLCVMEDGLAVTWDGGKLDGYSVVAGYRW